MRKLLMQMKPVMEKVGQMKKVVSKWKGLPEGIVENILFLVIENSVPGFAKCNTYQGIIQTCQRLQIVKKKGKGLFPQIQLYSTS